MTELLRSSREPDPRDDSGGQREILQHTLARVDRIVVHIYPGVCLITRNQEGTRNLCCLLALSPRARRKEPSVD